MTDANVPVTDALAQRFWCDVDELDLVRAIEFLVRDHFARHDPRHLFDEIFDTLDMLHIDCRDDIDGRRSHVLDVLPPLLVAHPRNVGVRQLVNQRDLPTNRTTSTFAFTEGPPWS